MRSLTGWLRPLAMPAAALMLAGCPSATQQQTGTTTQPAATAQQQGQRTVKLVAHGSSPRDARTIVEQVVQLDLYRLSLPFGTVSSNEAFWKTIDEQCVDIATYDLLFKNGLRVGRAATAQWDEIAKLIADNPASTYKSAIVGGDARSLEMLMKKGDDGIEHIFYYNAQNLLIGRSFERWENFMELSFQATPRKPRHVRVALVPAVRSLRRRLEYNFRNEQQPELQYTAPERLYDLNLRADLPPDTFLIVAPSGEGKWPTSIGSAFLVNDAPAERMEHVLLIVPKPMLIDPTQVGAQQDK